MTKIITLEKLTETLHAMYATNKQPTVEEVTNVLESYHSNAKDWKAKYADGKWSPVSYTRNLVDEGNGRFNLIILLWSEGQGSPIHDHSNSDCFVKILQGNLKETLYTYPSTSSENSQMVQAKSITFHKDQVTYIHDNQGVVHRMENPSHTEGCVSLHLYTPPFDMCNKFDDVTSQKTVVTMSYNTKYGMTIEPLQAKGSDSRKSCLDSGSDNQYKLNDYDRIQHKNKSFSQNMDESFCEKNHQQEVILV